MIEILCIVVGWSIGEIIYQRLKWWVSKKYYLRQSKKIEGEHASFLYFNSFELMMCTSSKIISKGGVFVSYQEVDFSRMPHRVIIKINSNIFEKE